MRIWTYLIFGSLIVVLASAAFLPLLDVNLLIHEMSVTNEPVDTHFLAIRSATFASLVFFTINFLRNKRPLSAVAPMLAFCNFLVFLVASFVAHSYLSCYMLPSRNWCKYFWSSLIDTRRDSIYNCIIIWVHKITYSLSVR